MTRTTYQTTDHRDPRHGLAMFATHAPASGPAYGGLSEPTRTHTNRTAIIGATGVALLIAAMAGIAYYQYQQVEPAAVAPSVSVAVPQSVYDSQVPAAARLTPTVSVPRSVYDSQVPAAAGIRVPLRAQAALAADTAAAIRVTVPQSVYDQQVPHGAAATVEVPQSVYDQQVPDAATVPAPHGAAPTG